MFTNSSTHNSRAWQILCYINSDTWCRRSGRRCTKWPRCSCTASTTGSWRLRRPERTVTCSQRILLFTRWTTQGTCIELAPLAGVMLIAIQGDLFLCSKHVFKNVVVEDILILVSNCSRATYLKINEDITTSNNVALHDLIK